MTTYLGKSCSFCLPRVPFVNYRQFMYLVISLLVLRAGCGIWLYQFLIIAYLFTLEDSLGDPDMDWAVHEGKSKTIETAVKLALEFEPETAEHHKVKEGTCEGTDWGTSARSGTPLPATSIRQVHILVDGKQIMLFVVLYLILPSVFVILSCLVSWAGCGIRLYWVLISWAATWQIQQNGMCA